MSLLASEVSAAVAAAGTTTFGVSDLSQLPTIIQLGMAAGFVIAAGIAAYFGFRQAKSSQNIMENVVLPRRGALDLYFDNPETVALMRQVLSFQEKIRQDHENIRGDIRDLERLSEVRSGQVKKELDEEIGKVRQLMREHQAILLAAERLSEATVMENSRKLARELSDLVNQCRDLLIEVDIRLSEKQESPRRR